MTRNIREDKGYTYSPFSFILVNRFGGACIAGKEVRNAVTGPSLKGTFFELRRISTEPPSPEEMEHARRYLIGSTALDLQSRTQVAVLLAKCWINAEPANHLDAQMAEVEKATAQEATEAAAKYLAPENITVIAVGEKSVILDQLKPLGMDVSPVPNLQ